MQVTEESLATFFANCGTVSHHRAAAVASGCQPYRACASGPQPCLGYAVRAHFATSAVAAAVGDAVPIPPAHPSGPIPPRATAPHRPGDGLPHLR
jgi:hypothetical protein